MSLFRQDTIIKKLSGERITPFALAKKLDAKVILESASFTKGRSRYSILMIQEAFRVYQENDEIIIEMKEQKNKIKSKDKDILDFISTFSDQHEKPSTGIPFPSGGIGFLSFEFSQNCDSIHLKKKFDPLDLPDAMFLFGHIFIVYDHFSDLIYIIGLNYNEQEIDLNIAVDGTLSKINDLDFNYLLKKEKKYSSEIVNFELEKADYIKSVETIRHEIIKGNLLQAVPSRRLQVKTEIPAMEAYGRLRMTNPSPYLFYIDFTDFQMFGSSPEVHLKIENKRALLRPIAGTRRRGINLSEDKLLEKELLEDKKEGSEHLMLVDLARNDLGRICKSGTVVVSESRSVERYSHVMHLVSQVEGELHNHLRSADAIRATFPAGTVSGAPKIKAIEIISEIEKYPRRFYAGLIGIMEPGGNIDTCITIRSALKKDGYIYMQAGGGVVYDSTAEREYEETSEKLRAMANALGVEV